MTRLMWRWVLGLAVADALVLGLTVHAIATWTQPATDDEQVLTLPQLLGILLAGALTVVIVVILVVARRRGRVERQVRRWQARADDVDLDS